MIHTAYVLKNWHEQHESELENIEWPPQSPELNNIKRYSTYNSAKPLMFDFFESGVNIS